MSEEPVHAVVRVDGTVSGALEAGTLVSLGEAVWSEWLLTRRWFGGKGTVPRHVRVVDSVQLAHAAHPVAVARLDVEPRSGRTARYQAPLAVVHSENAPPGALARVETGDSPRRAWLVDAGVDTAFGARVARAYANGESFESGGVTWRFEAEEGVDLEPLRDAPVREMGAEQSNSSLRCGDVAILKLYRRLEQGTHPEVEMSRYLTRSNFRSTPRLLGVAEVRDAEGHSAVAGVVLELIPGARDAWGLAVDRATEYIDAPGDADPANPFERDARALGHVIGEMHRALATADNEPAFKPSAALRHDVVAWVEQARTAMAESFELLASRREADGLHGLAASVADAVLKRREEILVQVTHAADSIGDDAGLRIRHHGDLHLGQVLRGRDGEVWIIDFEGEPARPLASRRVLHSALRDVAGMLRSFSYAAAVGAQGVGGVGVQARVELRLSRWERAARASFLNGYLGVTAGVEGLLSESEEGTDQLLALFEMEKVFYELAYELDNRPEMTWIPLRGIGRILGR